MWHRVPGREDIVVQSIEELTSDMRGVFTEIKKMKEEIEEIKKSIQQ
jgi:hypothetical protein